MTEPTEGPGSATTSADFTPPDVWMVLQEIEGWMFKTGGWERYLAGLTPPYDPLDEARNIALQQIIETVQTMKDLTGWDIGSILLLAGCTSTVEDVPHITAPTAALQFVLGNLFEMEATARMVAIESQSRLGVPEQHRAQLTRRLLLWGVPSESTDPLLNTALAAIRRMDWKNATARATAAVAAAGGIVDRVSASEELCRADDVVDALAPPLPSAFEQYHELVLILVAADVLELSGGTASGLLFVPAPR